MPDDLLADLSADLTAIHADPDVKIKRDLGDHTELVADIKPREETASIEITKTF